MEELSGRSGIFVSVGATGLDRDVDALFGDSAELIERARLLLLDARACLEAADETPAVRPVPAPRTRRKPIKLVVTAPAAAGLLLLGIAVGELANSSGPTETALSVRTTAATDSPAPAIAPPSGAPVVPPAPVPTWVSIPRLDAKATVASEVRVISGGPENGLLSAPPNYHDLGWFRRSAGSVLVLDGHVGYRRDPGPLAFIGNLKPGDQVILGTQSGDQLFRVQTVGHVLKGRLPSQYFSDAYGADLMLITCDYSSPFTGGHFEDNVYAVAAPA